ncbi:hypothetical protein [Acinetobacter sp. ACZLY 512]|uniref:hypothetical protein n=1 Tax=Acinetobacter sp. ACZLY 512 TaxID=2911206 RepID=UPI0032EF6511
MCKRVGKGGGIPNYDNGDAFTMLWQIKTGVDRYPRVGEELSYKYRICQQDFLDMLDDVIEQLDWEIEKIK